MRWLRSFITLLAVLLLLAGLAVATAGVATVSAKIRWWMLVSSSQDAGVSVEHHDRHLCLWLIRDVPRPDGLTADLADAAWTQRRRPQLERSQLVGTLNNVRLFLFSARCGKLCSQHIGQNQFRLFAGRIDASRSGGEDLG